MPNTSKTKNNNATIVIVAVTVIATVVASVLKEALRFRVEALGFKGQVV